VKKNNSIKTVFQPFSSDAAVLGSKTIHRRPELRPANRGFHGVAPISRNIRMAINSPQRAIAGDRTRKMINIPGKSAPRVRSRGEAIISSCNCPQGSP
jgi:hypothetical protein